MPLPSPAPHYIDGSWIGDASYDQTPSIDPSTGELVGLHYAGNSALADQAIAAARHAFETTAWPQSPRVRAQALLEFANGLEAIKEELAYLLSRESGKVLADARHEISASVSELRYYAGLARNIFGRSAETTPNAFSMISREPAGVAAIVVPWNAPVTLLVRSLAPALAAGCTVVIKPAAQTSLTHWRVMECLAAIASLPKGVVNSVNERGSEVGEAIARSVDVDVISFTGSSATGKKIMAASANTLKRLSLELGGKAPAVIFPDADLEKATAVVARSAMVVSGQMCMAVTRILVHADIRDAFAERLIDHLRSVKIGCAYTPGVEMGPLIDRANQTRVCGLIERANEEGEILLRGAAGEGDLAAGAFVTPTLFEIEDLNSSLVQDESFGPIVSLERFSDEAEAVTRANATRYGLGASIWTHNLERALRVSRAVRAGTVWLNSHTQLFAEIETGGYKESGLGRLHGVGGLDDFLETKHIYMPAGGPAGH